MQTSEGLTMAQYLEAEHSHPSMEKEVRIIEVMAEAKDETRSSVKSMDVLVMLQQSVITSLIFPFKEVNRINNSITQTGMVLVINMVFIKPT